MHRWFVRKRRNKNGIQQKRLIAAAMAGVLAMMSAFPGYAASRKKITSVSVSIKADIEPETDLDRRSLRSKAAATAIVWMVTRS